MCDVAHPQCEAFTFTVGVVEAQPFRGHAAIAEWMAHELEPWDVLFFARGPEGAHRVQNDTDETVRVLMFSEVVLPTATVYPDSDKVGIWTGNKHDNVLVRKSSAVGYYHGET